jgi:hypothetical protein
MLQMLTALDAPPKSLDEDEKNVVAKIREHGWFNHSIMGDAEGPGFSYTTGFWLNAKHPELMIFNMKHETAHDVFWELYRDVRDGKHLKVGGSTDQAFANLPAYVFPVAKRYYREYLGWNRFFYAGDDFPCVQIVWPDRAGFFPWESDFDPTFKDDQPDLTENGWLASISE